MTKPKPKPTSPKVGGTYFADGYRCVNCGWEGWVKVPRGKPADASIECLECGSVAVRIQTCGEPPHWKKYPHTDEE